MKRFVVLVVLLFIGFSLSTFAQKLSREEERALKNELRDLAKNPEKYRNLKQQDTELTNQIRLKQDRLTAQNNQMAEVKKQVEDREYKINALKVEMGTLGKRLTAGTDSIAQTVVFKVQLGAYRNPKLSRYLRQNHHFTVEDSEEGIKRYVVGKFNSYWEAKKLSEHFSHRGAQAYVVGYINGVRVPNLKQMPQEYF
jgi:predicted RNase H-like nuclease (RuvC/YqgF family)